MSRTISLKRNVLSVAVLAACAAFSLVLSDNAFAVTDALTITSGPTVTTAGALTETGPNTIAFQQVSGNAIKLFGGDTLTSSGGNGTFLIDTKGTVTANSGDVFTGTYDFTLQLTGTGSAGFTLRATVTPFPGFTIPVFTKSNTTPLQGPDTLEYSGTASTTSPISGTNIPFELQLTGTLTGAASGDTLSVTIPSHSIDLAIASPVPEPAALPLLLLGLGTVLSVRRFMSRRHSA